jgi:phage tail sheath protein FI
VFEPQEPELWTRITQSVEGFLHGLFEQGALAGVVPTDSYRVQCDAENNPSEQLARGVLTITVQFAMFKIGAFQTLEIEHALPGYPASE